MLNIIVTLPFLSALVLALIYLYDPTKRREKLYTFLGVGSIAITAVLALMVLFEVFSSSTTVHSKLFEWIAIDEFRIPLAFMADPLSSVMISFVTTIGLLIHIYAVGYMSGDKGFGKFFSYFNLFMGSMLLLVLADNPVIMFIGWELVGLSSYLLIGYYHKDRARLLYLTVSVTLALSWVYLSSF